MRVKDISNLNLPVVDTEKESTKVASDRWEKNATDVPGKTIEEIKQHYELLVEDNSQIESVCVPLSS